MSAWKSLQNQASSKLQRAHEALSQRDLKSDLRNVIPVRRELRPGETGYVEGQNTTQSWRTWAGEQAQKLKRGDPNSTRPGAEELILFPGWATRRYRTVGNSRLDEFDVEVFISGYACVRRPPELATRSQRAFLRLAKGFASLPKLANSSPTDSPTNARSPVLSPSTEDLLATIQLPPRPEDITEDYEIEALEKQFRKAEMSTAHGNRTDSDAGSTVSSVSSRSSSPVSSRSSSFQASSRPASLYSSNSGAAKLSDLMDPPYGGPSSSSHNNYEAQREARRLHSNLERRLQPFWSTSLTARTVRLSLFCETHGGPQTPLAVTAAQTMSDGSFQASIFVHWEDMCQHPEALHIAFGDPKQEHQLVIASEILPPPSPSSSPGFNPNNNHLHPLPHASSSSLSPSSQEVPLSRQRWTLPVPLTHSEVRVISDIDDTVKLSNILSGARTVFYNVFVKDLHEAIIPGMGEWYTNMWQRGVRFHYVSNGPFELLDIVREFFQLSGLPPGSVRLKSYAGRSLFNGLLSAPATRKRAGVEAMLDAFPNAKFICVGDTGEQDLELYAQFAVERPDQILAVFVRDAQTGELGADPVQDPTGLKDVEDFCTPLNSPGGVGVTPNAAAPALPRRPLLPRVQSSDSATPQGKSPLRVQIPSHETSTGRPHSAAVPGDYFTVANKQLRQLQGTPAARFPVSPWTEEPESYYASASGQTQIRPGAGNATDNDSRRRPASRSSSLGLTEMQKRRLELQQRIWRARKMMPAHIPLRIFRSPEECVEAWQILDKLGTGKES